MNKKSHESTDLSAGKPETLIIHVDKGMNKSVANTNERLKELEITCADDSKLDYVEMMISDYESSVVKKITLGRNAELTIHKVVVGSKNKFSHTTITLGENSILKVMNLFLANGQKQEHTMKIIHKGQGSKSELHNRGILSNADMMLNGLIRIERFAENAEGTQKSDMLILNDSKAISLPNLEILNNNVKCNHSSSITQIDEEKTFYLRSRGIGEMEAKEMMINAFIRETLEMLSEEKKESLLLMLTDKVSKMIAEQ